MPALVTCGKQWNVGSDDFVLPALFAVIARLVCIGAVIGVLIYLFVGPEGCPEPQENVPPFLYGSLFAFIGVQLLTVLVENVIFSISAKGTIYDHRTKKPRRRSIGFWLLVRVGLFFVETAVVIVCTVAVFGPAPYAAGALQCPEYHDGPLVFAEAVTVGLIVLLSLYAIGFSIYLDPLGICCAPSLLKDTKHLQDHSSLPHNCKYTEEGIDGDGEGTDADSERKTLDEVATQSNVGQVHRNHIGFGRIFRKFRGVVCCLSAGGKRSRTTAMQEVALALHTVFSDVGVKKPEERVVPSDLVAGMILVSRNQKSTRENCPNCSSRDGISCTCLSREFRTQTLDKLREKGDVPQDYETIPPREFDFNNESEKNLFEDLVYYMHYAMGIYGWTLHLFDNLCCGVCQLCSVTCCVCNYRCVHERYDVDFHQDDLCMSGVGTIRLRSKLNERHIYYATYENDYYKAPFSICIDNEKEAIVLSVRGTLSLKDALTDMSPRMHKICECQRIHHKDAEGEQYIHVGMYWTAMQILSKEKDPNWLTNMLDNLRSDPEYRGYKLVITGHSLGAGVASVLAVLLKPKYEDLVCYAFSPPGCVLSFPLTRYSRSFTTSVVLGNDMIPRVSFQSLGNLKHQILHLLENCEKPKAQVIFQPRWVERYVSPVVRKCCCGPHTDPQCDMSAVVKRMKREDTVEETDFSENPRPSVADISSAIRAVQRAARKWKSKLYKEDATLVENIKKEKDVAAFPPGNIVHIRVTKTAKPLCLGYCYPNKLSVERISSEDLCVLLMDRGMVDDHLPNSVLNALKRCKSQFLPNSPSTRNEPPQQEKEPSPITRQISHGHQVQIDVEEFPLSDIA